MTLFWYRCEIAGLNRMFCVDKKMKEFLYFMSAFVSLLSLCLIIQIVSFTQSGTSVLPKISVWYGLVFCRTVTSEYTLR